MKRKLNQTIANDFLNSSLWLNKIKNDCLSQKVFLTIRDNRIDLYYKGGLLFCYDKNGFKTHVKYASVITLDADGKNYLTESQLSSFKLASDFESNYSRIKENCSNYSGIEACGVSDLYHKHSYLSDCNVVVLDIEVSFESFSEKKKHDRIDIVLLNKVTRTLHFVEAKHFSNGEIWSEDKPQVIAQINRYESQIRNRKTEILSEYVEYVKTINGIFGISLPEPIDFEKNVTLLIFGFDNDQKKGRLKSLILKNPKYSGIKNYSKGNIKNIVTENLWNAKELQ